MRLPVYILADVILKIVFTVCIVYPKMKEVLYVQYKVTSKNLV